MKTFKNISLITTFAFALVLSSCTGITDANQTTDEELTIQVEDLQDQNILQGGDEDPKMVRVRPD